MAGPARILLPFQESRGFMSAEYLVGRAEDVLSASKSAYVDALFAAGRHENETYTNLQVEHSESHWV